MVVVTVALTRFSQMVQTTSHDWYSGTQNLMSSRGIPSSASIFSTRSIHDSTPSKRIIESPTGFGSLRTLALQHTMLGCVQKRRPFKHGKRGANQADWLVVDDHWRDGSFVRQFVIKNNAKFLLVFVPPVLLFSDQRAFCKLLRPGLIVNDRIRPGAAIVAGPLPIPNFLRLKAWAWAPHQFGSGQSL